MQLISDGEPGIGESANHPYMQLPPRHEASNVYESVGVAQNVPCRYELRAAQLNPEDEPGTTSEYPAEGLEGGLVQPYTQLLPMQDAVSS